MCRIPFINVTMSVLECTVVLLLVLVHTLYTDHVRAKDRDDFYFQPSSTVSVRAPRSDPC